MGRRDTVRMVKERFGTLALSCEGLEAFQTYRDATIPSNCMIFYLGFPTSFGIDTAGLKSTRYEFAVELYLHGVDREEMTERMEGIMLDLQDLLDDDPRLGRTFSKPCELVDSSAPVFLKLDGEDQPPTLFKRMRLLGEKR